MNASDTPFGAVLLDDDPTLHKIVARALSNGNFDLESFTDPRQALRYVESTPDLCLMLCDIDMPQASGFDVLTSAKQLAPELAVIMLTGDESAESAVRAMHAGAFTYMTKSQLQDPSTFLLNVTQAASFARLQQYARQLESRLEVSDRYQDLVGTSEAMVEIFSVLDRVAPLDVNVLIRGETGTGKELIARAIHRRSARAAGPFVALNCGALPETLVDSELFGHTRGAFTGATTARAGAFERASGGTLFLDEIGDVPPQVQLRLLRVLQEGEVQRLGGASPTPVDVRVVAATLVDLEAVVEDGTFRPDLFYRLDVVSLRVPPLRRRLDDLPLLTAHLIEKHCGRLGRQVPRVHADYFAALTAYDWPGNVRELENALQSSLALCGGDELTPDVLPPRVRPKPARRIALALEEDDLEWADGMPFAQARQAIVDRFEYRYLQRVLRRAQGNVSVAARAAGLDRSNLRRAMKRVNLSREDYADAES